MIHSIIKRLLLYKWSLAIKPLRTARGCAALSSFEPGKAKRSGESLRASYELYINNISRDDMAASLELSGFLQYLCEGLNAGKIIDFGSGFSSFVFRKGAKANTSLEVWSVDDDFEWMEKTRSYLVQQRVGTGNLVMLSDFLSTNQRNFDLVFLDLNFVEVRKDYIRPAVECCKKGGVIIFDDVHKSDFLYDVLSRTRDLAIEFYDIKSLTLDKFGRFSLLGIKG